MLLFGNAVLTDVDNYNWNGGTVRVAYSTTGWPTRRLELSGAFSIIGDDVYYNDTTLIGTRNALGGRGDRLLRIVFNSNATRPLVQQLLRSVRFRTEGTAPIYEHQTITAQVTDGGNVGSGAIYTQVNIV